MPKSFATINVYYYFVARAVSYLIYFSPGEIPQYRVWEDIHHVAFLTPWPNTPGFTVLIPRKHLSNDIFSLQEDDYIGMLPIFNHFIFLKICYSCHSL